MKPAITFYLAIASLAYAALIAGCALLFPQTAAEVWSIGIYTGSSPFRISEPAGLRNPLLTPGDVADFAVNIVAHPFMVIERSKYYLFFTAKNDRAGEVSGIGLAEGGNGTEWRYSRIVLKTVTQFPRSKIASRS